MTLNRRIVVVGCMIAAVGLGAAGTVYAATDTPQPTSSVTPQAASGATPTVEASSTVIATPEATVLPKVKSSTEAEAQQVGREPKGAPETGGGGMADIVSTWG